MTPETAYWLLSTIAQVSATVVGLVIVATVFILAELRRVTTESSNAEEYVRKMGHMTGAPSTFILIIAAMAIISVLVGTITAMMAVTELSKIEEVLTQENTDRIREIKWFFTGTMFFTAVFASTCAAIGYIVAGREAKIFEDAHGGKEHIEELIKKRAKESQKKSSTARRSLFQTRETHSEPIPGEHEAESCSDDEGEI